MNPPKNRNAQIAIIKGWKWHDDPFPYPSPDIAYNFMHWEDEEGKPRILPDWEGKRWPELLWELQGYILMRFADEWLCHTPENRAVRLTFSSRDNPGGCVCDAWIAVKEKEAVDADT